MSYQVGVDVGGSFTTAAVVRGGRAEVVKIVPSRLPGVPRGLLKRVGDDTPVLIGGRPVPAETLVAQMVTRIVANVGTPSGVAVTHPVTWGPHRVAALRAALGEVTMLSAASAVAYRAEAPAAVHDLGGTTFTAAVVGGLATIGQPLELDLGGADLDELVFNHVRTAVGDRLPTDPNELAALRQACTVAKETLSADTEVEIPVADTRVRLTRAEFEDLARPLLAETAAAFRMTIEESGVTPASVLLAGGAAWLPLLTQVVSEELGRPVIATPPGAAAMGAALAAAGVPSGFAPRAARPAPPRAVTQPTRLTPTLEPLPANAFAEPTAFVEPARPPVPTPAAPPTARDRKPRTMIAVAAASLVAVGAAGAVLLSAGQQPAGAGADTAPPTTTVTETVAATTTTTEAPPVDTSTRRATQPRSTTTRRPTTTTTTEPAPTTTTRESTAEQTAPPTTTTANTPQSRGTETPGAGGR